ncbi:GtrA family protein [Fredinandcohnia humi]
MVHGSPKYEPEEPSPWSTGSRFPGSRGSNLCRFEGGLGVLGHSFVRFLLVGVVNTIVGLSFMYLFLLVFQFNYWASTFMGNAIGAVVSYFLNKRFTFQSNVPMGSSMIRFVLVIVGCYLLSYKVGLDMTGWILAKVNFLPNDYIDEVAVLVGSGLYTITNYAGQRFFVFPKKDKIKED